MKLRISSKRQRPLGVTVGFQVIFFIYKSFQASDSMSPHMSFAQGQISLASHTQYHLCFVLSFYITAA